MIGDLGVSDIAVDGGFLREGATTRDICSAFQGRVLEPGLAKARLPGRRLFARPEANGAERERPKGRVGGGYRFRP
ncbi:hypothetical protein GCM10009556_074090 [Acrocarpospora pleiomorpha]